MPLVQFMVQVIDTFASNSQNSESAVAGLLQRLAWPESSIFCRSAVLSSFALYKAALGVPCLLRLYTRHSGLDSVLIYLSRYFSSTLSGSLHAQLDEIKLSHSQGDFSSHSERFLDLMTIFGHKDIFTSVIREWSSLLCDSDSKRDELARWLLSLRSLPSQDPACSIEHLIISNLEELGNFLTHIIAASAQLEAESHSEPKLFEALHARFFEGLMLHMSGESSKSIPILHNIVQWSSVERYVPKERLNKWRHFAAVASQYAMSDNIPQLLHQTTKNSVIIESAKTQVPEHRLNWEALKIVFLNGGAASQHHSTDSATHHSSIRSWTSEELDCFLTNIYINMKGKDNEIATKVPLAWFLALIDQAPINIVYLAYVILEFAIEVSSDVKLTLFSPFLLNFFESLLKLQSSSPATLPTQTSTSSTVSTNSMDVDLPSSHALGLPSAEQKMVLVKGLFRQIKRNRSICAIIVTEITSRLCTGANGGEKSTEKWSLPILLSEPSSRRGNLKNGVSNLQKASSTGMDTSSSIDNAMELKLESMESNPSNILSNVRKRCRLLESEVSLGPEPGAKRMASGFLEPFWAASSSSSPSSLIKRHSDSSSTHHMPSKSDIELLILAETLSFPFIASSSSSSTHLPPHDQSSSLTQAQQAILSDISRPKHTMIGASGDLSSKLSECLVAEVDGRYPLVSAYDVYFDVLPKKPLFERNRYLEQLFLQRPILWSILESISANPTNLYPCRHIIMTLLTNFVGAWNAQPKGEAAATNSLWSHTLLLLRLLDICCNCGPMSGHNAPQPTYEALMQGVGVALELGTTDDVALLLLGFFRYCVTRLSTHSSRNPLGTSLHIQHWIVSPLRHILRKNIHLLSEKALFLYRRIIAFAAQNSAVPPSSSSTPLLPQQYGVHSNSSTPSVAHSTHPIPQNIL